MDKKLKNGIFTISLDFELHWGVSEHRTVDSYNTNLKLVPQVIDRLLASFDTFDIHATWATVGMLFNEEKSDFSKWVDPTDYPIYQNKKLSNYRLLPDIGADISEDPYHYALPLIKKIGKAQGQEIATHTYSHYYCLEKGQTIHNFERDLEAALAIAKKNNYSTKSIVFPRNQYNDSHIQLLQKKGISAYRGNEKHWMYRPRSREEETKVRQLARLIDSYINISGDNTQLPYGDTVLNIPSSRFLRPYSPTFKILDGIRLNRICKEMTHAAKENRLYHLWWHPHNFGKHLNENMHFLNRILKHVSFLKKEYNMQALNMSEISKQVHGQ